MNIFEGYFNRQRGFKALCLFLISLDDVLRRSMYYLTVRHFKWLQRLVSYAHVLWCSFTGKLRKDMKSLSLGFVWGISS